MNVPRIECGWRTLLLDPPWPYEQKLTAEDARGGAKKHYESMSIGEIASLPIADIAAEDCQLWLWTTNSHLPAAFPLLEAWGFTYRSTCTWVKGREDGPIQIGLGYWLRGATEHLLLASRGDARRKLRGEHGATGMAWSTVIHARKGKHSEKPEASYRMIEAMSEEPRLELFARKRRPHWASFGNQLESGMQAKLEF